MFDVILTS